MWGCDLSDLLVQPIDEIPCTFSVMTVYNTLRTILIQILTNIFLLAKRSGPVLERLF